MNGGVRANARHSPGSGIMPKLMRDYARRETDFMADLMEIITELSNERLLATRSRQEEAIIGESLKRTKEAQPLDELAYKRIHRDQAFGFQFAERHMNRPLIRASGTEAVRCEIDALADAHGCVAHQQED